VCNKTPVHLAFERHNKIKRIEHTYRPYC
jgi:hypothetical protein